MPNPILVGRYECGCVSLAVVDGEHCTNKDRASFWSICAKRNLTGGSEKDIKTRGWDCDGSNCKAPKKRQSLRKAKDS